MTPPRRLALRSDRDLLGTTVAACRSTVPPSPNPLPLAMEAIGGPDSELFRASMSPDGSEFYYFRKVTPGEQDYRVFRNRFDDGAWSRPQLLALGDSAASTLYTAISPDGRTLVFASPPEVDTSGTENIPVIASGGQGMLLFVRDFATLYHVPIGSDW